MKILTAKDEFIIKKSGGYRAFVARLLNDKWGVKPNWEIDKKAPPVRAWVNRSSWVADCECRGSLVVEPGEPYICPDCGNAAYGGRARIVLFPKKKAEIERLLMNRPYPANRNWLLTETITDLKRQNREKGDKE